MVGEGDALRKEGSRGRDEIELIGAVKCSNTHTHTHTHTQGTEEDKLPPHAPIPTHTHTHTYRSPLCNMINVVNSREDQSGRDLSTFLHTCMSIHTDRQTDRHTHTHNVALLLLKCLRALFLPVYSHTLLTPLPSPTQTKMEEPDRVDVFFLSNVPLDWHKSGIISTQF